MCFLAKNTFILKELTKALTYFMEYNTVEFYWLDPHLSHDDFNYSTN